ncbi:MAG: AI-2E family transporter [Acidobacteriota bacterium]
MSTTPSSGNRLLDTFLVMAISVTGFYILIVTKALLVPLVVAIFLWYLIYAVTAMITRLKIAGRQLPWGVALTLSLSTIFALFLVLGRLIRENVRRIGEEGDIYLANFDALVERTYQSLGLQPPADFFEFLSQIDISMVIQEAATGVAGLVGNAGLVFVYIFFLFLEQNVFVKKLDAMIHNPKRHREIIRLIDRIDNDVRTYIGLKTLVSAMTALPSYVIMEVVGLDFAAFWALLIFVLNFIPNVGSLIATVLPVLLSLVQFDNLRPFLIIAISVTSIQLFVANFIEPRIMGRSLNLSPLVIILSLVMWGSIWGVAGLFLSVPIMVIAMIILGRFTATRPIAIAMSADGDLQIDDDDEPRVDGATTGIVSLLVTEDKAEA